MYIGHKSTNHHTIPVSFRVNYKTKGSSAELTSCCCFNFFLFSMFEALEMSEESSSGNSIIQSKAIPNRKRKETEAVPDPSIVEEDILVHSDHSMSSKSAKTTLERNLDESPFGARVTGNDGVSDLIYYTWVSFYVEFVQKLHRIAQINPLLQ